MLHTQDLPRESPWRDQWRLAAGVTYLNHGSFGPSPTCVRDVCGQFREQLQTQPMDFFIRQLEPAWFAARQQLANLVGTVPDNLALVENSTYGMNVLARSFPLAVGDQVILTDHEYGAVLRTWSQWCSERGAAEPLEVILPVPVVDEPSIVEAVFSHVTDRTRLIVVSHITSPTAITLPVARICAEARDRGIAVCVDGPHAVAQLPLNLDQLGCDFYTASCHKWLCAPFGSGFLYVHPRWHSEIKPVVKSWGQLAPAVPRSWSDEFVWSGTRDPSAMLSIPAAIQFLAGIGWARFREYSHTLALYARRRLIELTGLEPFVPEDGDWFGSMAHVPLPPGPAAPLQRQLFERFHIEVPIIQWQGRRFIRVSCHLYNDRDQIDYLIDCLTDLIA